MAASNTTSPPLIFAPIPQLNSSDLSPPPPVLYPHTLAATREYASWSRAQRSRELDQPQDDQVGVVLHAELVIHGIAVLCARPGVLCFGQVALKRQKNTGLLLDPNPMMYLD